MENEVRTGNKLQSYCLENSLDRGAWRAEEYGVAKSWTLLSMHKHARVHTNIVHNRTKDQKKRAAKLSRI